VANDLALFVPVCTYIERTLARPIKTASGRSRDVSLFRRNKSRLPGDAISAAEARATWKPVSDGPTASDNSVRRMSCADSATKRLASDQSYQLLVH